MEKQLSILGVGITTKSEEEILEYLKKILDLPKNKRGKIIIFTPNPEQISHAAKDPRFKAILNSADIALPDGVGVIVGARLMGKALRGRIAGVDFMKNLVKINSKRPVVTGFFGGQPGVAEETAVCLQKMAPKITTGYASDVYDKEKLIGSDIDILFVALGSPKQEEWIMAHKDEVPANIIMAVGGSFDFISGRVPRAPKVMQDAGLEWLFRLIIQPWRIVRQAQLLHFSALIIAEALGSRVKK